MIETISWALMLALLVFAIGYPIVLVISAAAETWKERKR